MVSCGRPRSSTTQWTLSCRSIDSADRASPAVDTRTGPWMSCRSAATLWASMDSRPPGLASTTSRWRLALPFLPSRPPLPFVPYGVRAAAGASCVTAEPPSAECPAAECPAAEYAALECAVVECGANSGTPSARVAGCSLRAPPKWASGR